MNEAGEKTLFEKLGGADAVNAAVDSFYKKVMADERINSFFADVDMDRQAIKMKMFMAYAFGGMPNYPGASLRQSHQRLVEKKGLSDEHFDAVGENLQATLGELGVPADLIGEVMTIVGSTRDDVLNR